MRDILVYDQPKDGHYRRGVEVVARALDGHPLLKPFQFAWPQLVGWRGALICQSVSTYLKKFLLLAAVRSLLGRRTVALLVTDPRVHMEGWRQPGPRRWLFELVARLPKLRMLSIVMSECEPHPREEWIADVEWWDLSLAPLAIRDVVFPGRSEAPTVVFLGMVEERKGTKFFVAAAQAAAHRNANLRFAFVADATKLAAEDREAFEAAGGILMPRAMDDETFVSTIRCADWIWCCYQPSRDLSSGIFGRTLQLGTRSIVRKNSYLERFQKRYGNGIAVDYGDVEGLLAALASPQPALGPLPDITAFASTAIARLRAACGVA